MWWQQLSVLLPVLTCQLHVEPCDKHSSDGFNAPRSFVTWLPHLDL